MTINRRLGVLHGVRVLEIGHFVAAPFAARILADLGADVIKVEPPGGDPVRQWGEQIDGKSLWWSVHGRNKRCITLNLKTERAQSIVHALAAQCDVLIENFRPGQIDKLGLSPETLRRDRPDLIIAHISGYGQSGPYRDRAAFGAIGEAIGGLRHLTNHRPGASDLPPVRAGVSIGDSISGLYAVIGILAALWRREGRDGDRSAHTIDVALTESVLSLMEGMLPEYGALAKIKQPTGGGIATAAPSDAYPTADGGWVLIAANSEPLFAKLMGLMGREELVGAQGFRGNQERVENVAAMDALIADWTRSYGTSALIDKLTQADIPNSKVYTAADCASDPQYLHRGMIQSVDDPAFDGPVTHVGIVPRIDGENGVRWPGPPLGAHTREVLHELLAMNDAAIDALRADGVV
ncbi:CaiB/BaiF CoA transferase family protein [Terricaulis silvestris]|uniref:Bile acid-CoA hydrolase n=1 Tax=Terricaulis silvestris TaxID=2686094 RepID=A0A6I6MHB7_9CAUL|nr:CoA transferase [Terricaulis silvestris]QGZ93789.1 Bile acid-CoA hydrolase [Terricaulis silvestris]